MCSVVGPSGAELECSVLEEDWQRGQSYMAHWHSLPLLPQHHHRPTVMAAERSTKHWEARRLLQRFLSGAISKDYLHPKTCPARRSHQPVSDPPAMGPMLHGAQFEPRMERGGVTLRLRRAGVFETVGQDCAERIKG